MKRFVSLLFFLICSLTADCQPQADSGLKTAELPTADSLHAALDAHHDRLTTATLAEFDDAPANTWMNWTPAIGIGYAPNGEPRPTASFSLSQVFANLQRNKERKAKRQALEAAAQIARENAHRELNQMLQRHRLLEMELATMRQIFEIDQQLFSLALADYDAAKLSPMEFLPKKKAMLLEQLELDRKGMELAELEGEVFLFVGMEEGYIPW